MSIKNPLKPAGIEPATFRIVVQHLNHCATAVLVLNGTTMKYYVGRTQLLFKWYKIQLQEHLWAFSRSSSDCV